MPLLSLLSLSSPNFEELEGERERHTTNAQNFWRGKFALIITYHLFFKKTKTKIETERVVHVDSIDASVFYLSHSLSPNFEELEGGGGGREREKHNAQNYLWREENSRRNSSGSTTTTRQRFLFVLLSPKN